MLADFPKWKWDEADAVHQYGVSYAEATYEQKRQAAHDYIIVHCSKFISNENADGEMGET